MDVHKFFAIGRAFDNLDHKEILLRLLQENPALFCTLCDTVQPEEWMREAVRIIEKGDTISAIKLVRVTKGVGLKEAKDWADIMRDRPDEGYYSAWGKAMAQHFKDCGLYVKINRWQPPTF